MLTIQWQWLVLYSPPKKGIDAFLGATLAFASAADRPHYRHVAEQGLAELAALLRRDGVI